MTLSIDQIMAALTQMRAVDLAPRLERGIPRWPSHPHLTIDKAITHDHDGYYCQAIMMAEHTGAHVDAPAHVLPDRMERTIDTFPAHHLVAPAVLYDFADRDLKPGQLISADDLRRAEDRSGAAVGAGEIAMVNYGWMARYWRTDNQAQWYVLNAPGMTEDACEFFLDRGVKAVATDTVAAETAVVDGALMPNPGHMKFWLPNDILIIEMLRNLEQVTPRSLFVATPLHLHEGSGSPIRPVAYCPV